MTARFAWCACQRGVPCTHRGARAGAALNSLTTPPMQVGVLALEAHSLPGPASTVAGAHRALQWVAKHRCRDALPAPHLPARPPAGSGARLQRLLRHTHAKQNYYVSLIRMSGGDHPHSEPRQPTPQITRSSSCCESMRARDKSYKQTGLHLLIEAQQLDPKWYGQSPTAARLPAGRTCPKLTCMCVLLLVANTTLCTEADEQAHAWCGSRTTPRPALAARPHSARSRSASASTDALCSTTEPQ